MRFLKTVFASMLGYFFAMGLIVVAFILFVVGVASSIEPKQVEIPDQAVLRMKLDYPLVDRVNDSDAEFIISTIDPNSTVPVGLNQILHMLDEAATDDRIKGIVLDLTTVQAGYAKLSEVRKKLEEFKTSGKFIYTYADYYYYQTYYLASVADSIFINPEGQMVFNGLVAEVAMFSKMLDKIGVDMQVVRAGKFKGAVEPFIMNKLSAENKEQIQAYVNSIFEHTLSDISRTRNISVDSLKYYADRLDLRSVNDFIEHKLIDRAVYRDEFYAAMKRRMEVDLDKKVALISPVKYTRTLGKRGEGRDRVAVIYAQGEIVGGRGDGSQIAAEDMAATLKKVRESDRVKAVVFRINSGGGSSLASDIIWREARLLAKEKPLIVSMGDVAASGGYYIAMAADTIVAEPTTLTGSIGVFGLIPNAEKLLNDKMGVDINYVGTGSHSEMGRIDRPMTGDEREYIQEIIDDIYETFLLRVSEGRHMTRDDVDAIAQGRVWTGAMAQEIGLVDELGGLERAIDLAVQSAGLTTYKLKEYPKQQAPLDYLVEKLSGNISLESQVEKYTESLGFARYFEYLKASKDWNEKPSVHAMVPYEISFKNYAMH